MHLERLYAKQLSNSWLPVMRMSEHLADTPVPRGQDVSALARPTWPWLIDAGLVCGSFCSSREPVASPTSFFDCSVTSVVGGWGILPSGSKCRQRVWPSDELSDHRMGAGLLTDVQRSFREIGCWKSHGPRTSDREQCAHSMTGTFGESGRAVRR